MNTVTLKRALLVVELALGEASASIGAIEDGGYSAWSDRRRAAMDKLTADLAVSCGARIASQYDAARVKICGIASTSTTGVEGALKNWMTAARKRLSATAESA